jgi:hypothetical protein
MCKGTEFLSTFAAMKSKLILTVFLLVTVTGLRAQDLLRPDSSRFRWLMKPPPIHETLKPSAFDALRNMDESQKIPLSLFDTFPPTWSQFKCTFLDLPLPEEFALIKRFHDNMEMGKNHPTPIWFDPEDNSLRTINKLREIGEFVGVAGGGGGGLGTSVIQTLYDQYSHEGKMRRKYDSIIQQDDFERQIYSKYNVALVKQITGFTSDSVAYSFMRFCDFKNDSLMQANNYDIYWMIQNCLSQFFERK